MRIFTTFCLISMMCLLIVSSGYAQEEAIPEDEVPMSLQGYFYSTYKNAKEVSWTKVNNIGEELIRVTFSMTDSDKNVIYDMGGNLQEEISVRKKTNMDYIMSSKSLDKYPEGKVLALRKVTKFNLQGISNPQSYYEVSVKNGKEIVYVYFDDDKQLMKNDNVFNLAVN